MASNTRKDLLGTQYYLFDRLGSVVALTDSSGNAVNTYVYDPYGNHLAGTTEAVANPWQFAGGFKDAFSGYYKFGTRYYDPTIGRWTQPDPSGLEANNYLYAVANPVNFVDPTGQFSCENNRFCRGARNTGKKVLNGAKTGGALVASGAYAAYCTALLKNKGGCAVAGGAFGASVGMAGGQSFWEGAFVAGVGIVGGGICIASLSTGPGAIAFCTVQGIALNYLSEGLVKEVDW